jgi:hypothetical protein
MKYVNNLLEVDPKDIRHISDDFGPVQTIIKISKPSHESHAVVVIFEDGASYINTIDGRYNISGKQKFIFKPKKVRRLKPLHVVLAEVGAYKVWDNGRICAASWKDDIASPMLQYFGTTHISPNWHWDEKWIEEVDEEEVK